MLAFHLVYVYVMFIDSCIVNLLFIVIVSLIAMSALCESVFVVLLIVIVVALSDGLPPGTCSGRDPVVELGVPAVHALASLICCYKYHYQYYHYS